VSGTLPPDDESLDEELERLSRRPGLIVRHNPNPPAWEPPTDIHVINVTNINELTGDDWDETDERSLRS
jgi:hypothetical protein